MIMKMQSNSKLSAVLQKFYLQNKQWLSDILFHEDEARFFQKIFDKVFPDVTKSHHFQDGQLLSMGLYKLEERRNNLKNSLLSQRNKLESLIEDNRLTIIPDFMDENMKIENEINELFISDRLIKKELFKLVEDVTQKENEGLYRGVLHNLTL